MMKDFLMPDYYPEFRCKMGDCRASCCEGWRVSLSEDEYFRLLGMECSPDIRRRLDCAMHLSEGSGEDRYAEICHDYTGNCKLRMEDGRCLIQAEMGEESLPLICKLYPRAYRTEGEPECSCAASCERVTEMLFFRKEPLEFIRRKPEFNVPEPKTPTVYAEKVENEQQLRLFLIKLLQDRSVPLPLRIYRLGIALQLMQTAIDKGDSVDTHRLLDRVSSSTAEAPKGAPYEGLEMIKKIIIAMCRHGSSLNGYGMEIVEYFSDGDIAEKYGAACEKFDRLFPNWEEGFENLLVNHLFFTRFPFADDSKTALDGFLALGTVYASLRFLSVGRIATHESESDLVDILAAAFRLMEHTPFHTFVASLLRREKYDSPENILTLMSVCQFAAHIS